MTALAHSRTYLIWQGSIDAFFVHDDVTVLLVLWYIEFHMDGKLVCPWRPLGRSSVAQALVHRGSCWCFTIGLGIRFGRVLDQASANKRVMILV